MHGSYTLSMNPYTPPARLNRFQIEITTGCNLKCQGCQRTIEMAAGTWRNAHMAVDLFRGIIANAPPARMLVMQGIGEPSLHPHLPELCEIARDSGKFTALSFNTNALAREPAYFLELKNHGLNHVSISVDSLVPAVAERARSGTDTARLRGAIAALIQGFPGRVTLSVVLSRLNLDGLPDLLRDLAGLGGTLVEIQPLVSYSPAIQGQVLRGIDIDRARAMVGEAQARFPQQTVLMAAGMTPDGSRCRRPFRAAYVTVEGLLTPCCLSEDVTQFRRTSLAGQNFTEAWNADGMAAWFDRYLDRQPAMCDGCGYNPAGTDIATAANAQDAITAAIKATDDNRLDEGEAGLRKVLGSPPQAEALHRLGLLHHRRGDHRTAAAFLQASHSLLPLARTANNLATVLHALGQVEAAQTLLRETIRNHPDYLQAHRSLAAMLRQSGDHPGAAQVIGHLVRQAAKAGNMALVEQELPGLAAMGPSPDHLLTANTVRASGRPDLAARILERLLAGHPDDLASLLSHAMAQLPVCYDSDAQVQDSRRRYEAALRNLAEATGKASPRRLAQAASHVGMAKPFYLSYQGLSDRDLQAIYGRVVTRMITAADPAQLPPPPLPAKGERLRIGFVTSYFRFHSISKLFAGWMRHLDRQGFEVFAYDLNDSPLDDWAKTLLSTADRLRQGRKSDTAWIEAIAADRPHVLIYPEIGMDPNALRLACRRLAPVQCVAWGHPVTTGLPEMDYFLSSDLMEPPDGADHYTETLIRLPNLSIHYQPLPDGAGSLTRQALGLRDDALVYICCQSLFKYLPRHDDVFVKIAQALPQAQFLFIGAASGPRTVIFRRRLAKVFADAGLDFARHVAIAEPVPPDLFPALLRCGDVYLDSLGWSGGNTTLEAATVGLPMVTMAAPLMRGRHSAAILRQMGLDALVTTTPEAYIAAAIALADPKKRRAAAKLVDKRKARLFNDLSPVRALETFLRDAVAKAMDLPLA